MKPRERDNRSCILIVDDEPQLVAALADILEEEHEVLTATSPVSALRIIENTENISVILSDQRMPQMTGDQLFARAAAICPATRVLMTAYADLEAVIRAVNDGKIFNYVTKPWDSQYVITTVRNAIEFFELNRNLVEEHELLHQMMDNSLEGIAFKDAEHRYVCLNREECRLLGIDAPAQALGRTALDFLPPERADARHDDERRILATGAAISNRIERVACEGGAERWYASNKTPIRDSRGAVIGLLTVTRDVTESKKIERMKDEFVSTVSHELRTPLTSIRGSLALIRGTAAGELPAKAQELIHIASHNCDRLLRLINDILDIERIESGELRFELAPVDLGELIAEAVEANIGYGEGFGVSIRRDPDIPDATINVDRGRLLQVMANLLSNAIKFTPPGGEVRIGARTLGPRVRVSVIDQGPGIPEDFRSQVFAKFTQANASATRQPGGAGLGLSISKSILEQHGGTIGFDSEAGKGSTFFFDLPVL